MYMYACHFLFGTFVTQAQVPVWAGVCTGQCVCELLHDLGDAFRYPTFPGYGYPGQGFPMPMAYMFNPYSMMGPQSGGGEPMSGGGMPPSAAGIVLKPGYGKGANGSHEPVTVKSEGEPDENGLETASRSNFERSDARGALDQSKAKRKAAAEVGMGRCVGLTQTGDDRSPAGGDCFVQPMPEAAEGNLCALPCV